MAAFEQPANGAFLLLHVKTHLTDEMAEKYSRSQASRTPLWLRACFDYQTISDIHLMRHRIRFKTYKPDYDWQPFRDFLMAMPILSGRGKIQWSQPDLTQPRRVYDSPETFEELTVIEGYGQSRRHRFIARLFDVEGVIEVKGKQGEITIKRSPIYEWAEIEAGFPHGLGAQKAAP